MGEEPINAPIMTPKGTQHAVERVVGGGIARTIHVGELNARSSQLRGILVHSGCIFKNGSKELVEIRPGLRIGCALLSLSRRKEWGRNNHLVKLKKRTSCHMTELSHDRSRPSGHVAVRGEPTTTGLTIAEISASQPYKSAYIYIPVLTVFSAAASCRSYPCLLSCQSNSLTTSGSIGPPSRAVPFHV
jgi:hypothetical protein